MGRMPKRVCLILAGVATMVAFAALPANAADDIASKMQMCDACHGQNGVSVSANIPIVWGQQSTWLYKELHDYKSAARDNPIMSPLVKSFALEELRQAAGYFAAKAWPTKTSPAAAAAPPASMTNCRACHGGNYEGGGPAPRLAGQSYEYLLAAMNSFASGERDNNLDMPGFMKALTESQRDAIAHYLAGLEPSR